MPYKCKKLSLKIKNCSIAKFLLEEKVKNICNNKTRVKKESICNQNNFLKVKYKYQFIVKLKSIK